jgi:hypothetical protein
MLDATQKKKVHGGEKNIGRRLARAHAIRKFPQTFVAADTLC